MGIIERYIDWSRKDLKSERSRIEYARDLSMFEKWMITERNSILLNATKYDIELYKRVCSVGDRATNRKLSVIKSFYSYLYVDSKDIDLNPSSGIKRVKIKRDGVPKLVTSTSLDVLFGHELFPKDSYNLILSRTIFRTFYYTGIRLSELIGISVGDVVFNSRTITVCGKGGITRTVKFSVTLLGWLKEYEIQRDIIAKKNESAFFISDRGERLTKNRVWYFFTKLKRRTWVRINPHALRHTFASHALSRGMDLAQVQKMLGHAQVSTTSIYIDVAKSIEESYDKAFP